MFVLERGSKVVMVTPTSDPFFGVKGQQKGQIFNFVRFQRLRYQIVRLSPRIKSVHGDLDVRPFLQGQRSTERSNFQLCHIRSSGLQIAHFRLLFVLQIINKLPIPNVRALRAQILSSSILFPKCSVFCLLRASDT